MQKLNSHQIISLLIVLIKDLGMSKVMSELLFHNSRKLFLII